jgi:hypothetical protein
MANLTDWRHYRIGERILMGAGLKPYVRKKTDPVSRPLRIYALDPAAAKSDGAIATIEVPYEELRPGPVGAAFLVNDVDAAGQLYEPVDLEDVGILLNDGLEPTPISPQFRQQMVYAVCSRVRQSFRVALGRQLDWGFSHGNGPDGQLEIRPQGVYEENAYYDKQNGRLCFGYFQAPAAIKGRYLPKGRAFTVLSHDVIAHEVTHALLDGLRANFITPTSADTLAFHEGFADLIAVFHHFTYEEVVLAALRQSQGKIENASLLTSIAEYFGHTIGKNGPLRSAIDPNGTLLYDSTLEIHQLGSVLVSAVFDAYRTVFERRSQPYIRLATHGSGLEPGRSLPPGLSEVLAHEATVVARQFLNVLIRAVDYSPPIDIEFGDFLRAVITADKELIEDDSWGYREAWIDAFAARKIYPQFVEALSEDALIWRPPPRPLPPIRDLDFATLRFEGDPGNFFRREESLRQAHALGGFITQSQHLDSFGLVATGDNRLEGDIVDPPSIESIRVARRIGPDGQVLFDLVAEVVQSRHATLPDRRPFLYQGGCTIILDPSGSVRYCIYKSVVGKKRFLNWKTCMVGQLSQFWDEDGAGRLSPNPALIRALH